VVDKLLAEKAYEKIRFNIVSLRFKIGEALSEKQISSQLNLGRTPVREALLRLAREGLVVIVPRKGAFVSPINIDDFRLLFDARLMLESHCVRIAAERISDKKIEELRQLISRSESLIQNRNIDALLDIDRKFHMGVVQSCGNRYIEQIADQIYNQVTRLWYLSFTSRTDDELRHSARSHTGILDALSSRDPDRTSEANQEHLENFSSQIKKHFFDQYTGVGTGRKRAEG